MTTVATSITRIRRLIGDVNSQIFTDARIMRALGRAQQEWCRDTRLLVKNVLVGVPPRITACCTQQWEEAYAGTDKSFVPFFNDGTYAATQPWELDTAWDATGGYTLTSGCEAAYQTPQHELPNFLPDDFYAMEALWYDYKYLAQKDEKWVRQHYLDAFRTTGDVVHWFAMMEETRKKAFITHSIPTTEDSGTNHATLIDTALVDDAFTALYSAVPDLPTATSDSLEVQVPFEKYIEYKTAAKLLRSDTEIRDREKARHYDYRYAAAMAQAKRLKHLLFKNRLRGLGDARSGDLRPPPPRFPDHYPKVEFRGRN